MADIKYGKNILENDMFTYII